MTDIDHPFAKYLAAFEARGGMDAMMTTADELWRCLVSGEIGDAEVSCGIAEQVLGIDADRLMPDEPLDDGSRAILDGLVAGEMARAGRLMSPEGLFRVFRVVYVPEDTVAGWLCSLENPDGGGIGICWADCREGAIGYSASQKGTAMVIEAMVCPSGVDRLITILVETFQHEGELRLRPEARPLVHAVHGPDGPVFSPLVGHALPAGTAGGGYGEATVSSAMVP